MAKNTVAKSPKTLKQECITTLRKLASAGRISNKQKQVLLTDIIGCSARGDTSMVEVAYELLIVSSGEEFLANDADPSASAALEAAEEEFADQCIAFAKSIAEQQGGEY